MTKINLIAVLIPLLFHLNVNAGTLCQTTPSDSEKYSMELIPEEKGNIVLVKFTIPQDCYVIIKVMDKDGNTVQELVQEEMSAGTYNVYHKGDGNIFKESHKCIMEIYENHDFTSKNIYSKEIKLSSK